MPIKTKRAGSFAEVLHADGPDPERAAKLGLYAWLVGSWEMDVTTLLEDGARHSGQGEIHAGWVLQGRAIQDVWMIPRLQDRRPGIPQLPGAGNWFGTTLRIYDPSLDAWRILWNDPATGFFSQQTARARGRDIVQEGPDPRGGTMRWSFTELEPDSFRWTGERAPDGATWRSEVEMGVPHLIQGPGTRAVRFRRLDPGDVGQAYEMTAAATVTVRIPGVLRSSCGGLKEFPLPVSSVRGALEAIEQLHPALHRRICDETGAVRRHVNVFVNMDHMRDHSGLDTALAPGDVVWFLPAVSGG